MWHLRNYPTRRKLFKDVEDLRAENRHLSIELRNARTDLALEKTASSGYRHENRELKRKLKTLELKTLEAHNLVPILKGEQHEGKSVFRRN